MARLDVPTCEPGEAMGPVLERVRAAGWNACVVVNDEGVVLGLLRQNQLKGDPERLVDSAMRPGPTTFRPHVPIAEMAHFLLDHELDSSPITTSDGRLLGLLRREDAVSAAHGHPPHGH